jgi:hypothetical protein
MSVLSAWFREMLELGKILQHSSIPVVKQHAIMHEG